MSQSFPARLSAVLAGEFINKVAVTGAFIWVAHALRPERYGEVEWALSVLMVCTLAADAGLSTWGSSQVAAHPDEAGTLVAKVGGLRLVLALAAYLVLLCVALSYGGAAGTALVVYGLVLFLTPGFLQYLFNGLLQPRWGALGQAVRGSTFLLAVVLLVRPASSPSAVALAEVIGASALTVCNVIVLRRVFALHVPLAEGLEHPGALLARSWPIGASDLTWGAHWYAGLIILGYVATATDAAWQSAGLRLVMALHTGVWLYLYVLLPTLVRRLATDRPGWTTLVERSMRLTGWAGCAVALIGTLAARPILTVVFGPPFAAAVPTLRAMIWIVPISWMSGHIRYSLIAANHPRKDYHAALVGAGTTIGLTLLLAPSLHALGAGLALLGGTIANGIAAIWLSRGVLPTVAFQTRMAPSTLCCAGCLALGAILTSVAGEIAAALGAGAVLAALALFAERSTVRALLQARASAL